MQRSVSGCCIDVLRNVVNVEKFTDSKIFTRADFVSSRFSSIKLEFSAENTLTDRTEQKKKLNSGAVFPSTHFLMNLF